MLLVALESSHAIWGGVQLAKTLPKDANVVIVCRIVLVLVGLRHRTDKVLL